MGPRDDSSALPEHWRFLRKAVPEVIRRRNTLYVAVCLITLGALAIRLVALGARPAHFDEGRVAYWALRYHETGDFAYRPIIHGPFIQHVLEALFGWFGPSDVLSRLPVAIVGGLFPLSALLFREHLRDEETVFLALLLASNGVLLYYSRFLRSDVLVAAFMFTAFGFLVRLYDTRDPKYLYGVAVFLAFGIASKENAILYALTWLGGLALLIDIALFRPREAKGGLALIREKISWVTSRLPTISGLARSLGSTVEATRRRSIGASASAFRSVVVGHVKARWTAVRTLRTVVGAALVFAAVFVFMFAPRGSPGESMPWLEQAVTDSVTFGEALEDPLLVPDLVQSTFDYWRSEYFAWFDTSSPGDEGWEGKYREFGPQFGTVLFRYATPTMVFATIGFVRERYGVATSRNLVLFLAYGGFVSALAYPLAMDIFGAWNAVHAVVPLTIPAAVGLGWAYRRTRKAIDRNNGFGITIGTILAVLVVAQTGIPAYNAVYEDPASKENKLVQYAQPGMDLRDTLETVDIESVSARNSGTDVLVYGDSFVKDGNSTAFLPACMGGWGGWSSALPMPWYLHKANASVECAQSVPAISDSVRESQPPIILTKSDNVGVLNATFPGYETHVDNLRTFGPELAIMVNRSAIS